MESAGGDGDHVREAVLVDAYSDATGQHLLVIDLPVGRAVEFPGLDGVPGIDELEVSEVVAVTLNDRGEVLLNLLHQEHGASHAIAVWDSTTGLVETHPQLTADSHASRINHLGHVVGHRAGTATGDAFYWDRDTDLVHLLDRGGFPIADAMGVNDIGQIVGVVSDGQTQSRAAFWSDRTSTPTSVPGALGWVAEINAAGLVLKKGTEPGVWDSASGRWVDFPAVFGQAANAINDLGLVVGDFGDGRPAIWRPL